MFLTKEVKNISKKLIFTLSTMEQISIKNMIIGKELLKFLKIKVVLNLHKGNMNQ